MTLVTSWVGTGLLVHVIEWKDRSYGDTGRL